MRRSVTAIIPDGLEDIHTKVRRGERLSADDGLSLFRHPDLHAVGYLANIVRERKNGNAAFYIRNRHLNYTNVCRIRCRFCSFSRSFDAPDAYILSPSEIRRKLQNPGGKPYVEVHIVGGVHPGLPYSYYLDVLRTVRETCPTATVKAFTVVEIAQICEVSGKSVESTLADLRENGLDMLPGGGAEVFSERLRQDLYPAKIASDEWLGMARLCHRAGLRSNATMLYGHLETEEERVEHLLRLRELQDETGGFTAFVHLSFQSRNTDLSHLPGPSAETDLRVTGVSRLLLDNFDHIKAYWPFLTPKVAQAALDYGADDLDGTIVEEHVGHEAGAPSPQGLSPEDLRCLIREAGRDPVERDSFYRPV
jgi:aminodeoxyfutalosine synthase